MLPSQVRCSDNSMQTHTWKWRAEIVQLTMQSRIRAFPALVCWNVKPVSPRFDKEEGHKHDARAGTLLLRGGTERVGGVQPRAEKALGRL